MNNRLVSPFVMWAIVALGFAVVLGTVQHVHFFSRNLRTIVLGLLAFINWLYFFFGAWKVNRTPARSAAGIKQLASTGVYEKVRHPIYSADIILAWGVFLNIGTLRALLCVVWMTMVLIAWMRVEEKAMEQRFGDEYVDYKRRTPMLIPRLRKIDRY